MSKYLLLTIFIYVFNLEANSFIPSIELVQDEKDPSMLIALF